MDESLESVFWSSESLNAFGKNQEGHSWIVGCCTRGRFIQVKSICSDLDIIPELSGSSKFVFTEMPVVAGGRCDVYETTFVLFDSVSQI